MSAKFHWFHGDSVTELKARLNASENPWLAVILNGPESPLLRVVSGDAATADGGGSGGGDINDSHTCPPFMDCPPE